MDNKNELSHSLETLRSENKNLNNDNHIKNITTNYFRSI